MDGELHPEQVQVVESFIALHPHLQTELDLLLSTRLPAEDIVFDKSGLLSQQMPEGSVQEDLLLYIDKELAVDKVKLVEFELAANPLYQLQHQQLLRTKLDPTETILHPDRTELYRREHRVIGLAMWMRIAAAVIVLMSMGIFFVARNNDAVTPGNVAAHTGTRVSDTPIKDDKNSNNKVPALSAIEPVQNIAQQKRQVVKETATPAAQKDLYTDNSIQEQQLVASNEVNTTQILVEKQTTFVAPQPEVVSIAPLASAANEKNIVTSLPAVALQPTTPSEVGADDESTADGNSHKGSFKSFLRKATRVIGRTTGLSQENDEKGEEVLIGAIALKRK
jgi:hypothetical protein